MTDINHKNLEIKSKKPLEQNIGLNENPFKRIVVEDDRKNELIESDGFIKSQEKMAEENDGKFSAKVALKNLFFTGIKNTLKQVASHPAETVLSFGAIITVSAFCPILIPAMSYVGIAFGGFEIVGGVKKAIQCYKKNDLDGLENSFKDLGSGVFTFGTSGIIKNPLQRFLKFTGKTTKHLAHEAANWYKKVYFPQLKKGDPLAVGFGIFNVVEGIHIGHSMITFNPVGMVTALALFLGVKYLYMGIHYRKPIQQGLNAAKQYGPLFLKNKTVRNGVRNGLRFVLKEFLTQFNSYVLKGKRSEPLALFAELNFTNKTEMTALNVAVMCKLPKQCAPMMDRTRAQSIINMFVEWSTTKNPKTKLELEQQFMSYAMRFKQNLRIYYGDEVVRQIEQGYKSPIDLVMNNLPLGLI